MTLKWMYAMAYQIFLHHKKDLLSNNDGELHIF